MFLLTLFYNAFSLLNSFICIYRCATYTLPLPKGKVAVAQR